MCAWALIFWEFDIRNTYWLGCRIASLAMSFALMVLYEIYWIRYFKSEKTMKDFYRSLLGIPVPGAALPVIAFFLLGIYECNALLLISAAILGIGHIGIHVGHRSEILRGK